MLSNRPTSSAQAAGLTWRRARRLSRDRTDGRTDGWSQRGGRCFVAPSLWRLLFNGLTLHSHPSGERLRVTAAAAIGSRGVSFTTLQQHKSIRDNQPREPGGFFQQLPERSGGPMGRTPPTERFCRAANFLVNDQKQLKKQQLCTNQDGALSRPPVRAAAAGPDPACRTETVRSAASKRNPGAFIGCHMVL